MLNYQRVYFNVNITSVLLAELLHPRNIEGDLWLCLCHLFFFKGTLRILLWGTNNGIWGWVKTLVPSEPQNSWDLWMFIPLKVYL